MINEIFNQVNSAAAQGTFAVGGCIVENSTGRIIHAMHNNVLKPLYGGGEVFTYDPTAHGERQLVYWYYEKRNRLNLPAPRELTIVTSLDPCAMCAGTILTAGFNVGVIAPDDYAGINCYNDFSFKTLPVSLRKNAKLQFGYYSCEGMFNGDLIKVRGYAGGPSVAFKDTVIAPDFLGKCGSIFQDSLVKVRSSSSETGLPASELLDPALLPENSVIKSRFRSICQDALKLKFELPHQCVELKELLQRVLKAEQGAKNAVALLDPFGNMVLCLPDTFSKSPVHTAFMNVTRMYALGRYELMNDVTSRQETLQHLTHPKHGTFVFLHAPNPHESTTIMNLGAYGSTMEGPLPESPIPNLQYLLPPLVGSIEELHTAINNLPPFYTDYVKIRMEYLG